MNYQEHLLQKNNQDFFDLQYRINFTGETDSSEIKLRREVRVNVRRFQASQILIDKIKAYYGIGQDCSTVVQDEKPENDKVILSEILLHVKKGTFLPEGVSNFVRIF